MADFCQQCHYDLFGPGEGDMYGLVQPEQFINGFTTVVLCESCGPTFVDHHGACIRNDCGFHGHPMRSKFEVVDLSEIEPKAPAWMVDLTIDWYEGFSNAPAFKAIVLGDVYAFANEPIWQRDGSRWFCESGDGRMMQHFHSGKLAFREGDPTVLQTDQQDGYAGRHFEIIMKEPIHGTRNVILRGPWHGCPPTKYNSVSTRQYKSGWQTYTFGLEMSHDLLIPAYKHFYPGEQLLNVCRDYIPGHPWYLEPVKHGTEAKPKDHHK